MRDADPVFRLWRPYKYWQEVVGESHYYAGIQDIVSRYSPAETGELHLHAHLAPERWNQADPNAVRVEIDGSTVGYIPEDEAESLAATLGPIHQAGAQVLEAPARLWWRWNAGAAYGSDYIASVSIDLPGDEYPLGNQPPAEPSFMLPKGRSFKVLDLQDDLVAPLVAHREEVYCYVVLFPADGASGNTCLALRLDGSHLGQISAKGQKALHGWYDIVAGTPVPIYTRCVVHTRNSAIEARVWLSSVSELRSVFPHDWEELQALVEPDRLQRYLPSAAWYPDPEDALQLRYWDGSAWTERRTPAIRSGREVKTGDVSQAPAEGWYPDPEGRARLRYWNGAAWTEHLSD